MLESFLHYKKQAFSNTLRLTRLFPAIHFPLSFQFPNMEHPYVCPEPFAFLLPSPCIVLSKSNRSLLIMSLCICDSYAFSKPTNKFAVIPTAQSHQCYQCWGSWVPQVEIEMKSQEHFQTIFIKLMLQHKGRQHREEGPLY